MPVEIFPTVLAPLPFSAVNHWCQHLPEHPALGPSAKCIYHHIDDILCSYKWWMQVLSYPLSQYPNLSSTLFSDTKEAKGGAMFGLASRWRSLHQLLLPSSPHPHAPSRVPPLSPSCCPNERTSCTLFIPLHRGRTYVGDLRETDQRESEKAFRVEFLRVAGLLFTSQGLHAFSLLIRECESDSLCFTCKCDWDFL